MLIPDEAKRGDALGQHLGYELRFEFGELGTEAIVHALAEGDVVGRVRSVDVELVGIVEQARFSVGRMRSKRCCATTRVRSRGGG